LLCAGACSTMAGSFRQLVVYRLAVALGDDAYRIAAGLPPLERWSLGIQLMRAADSVGANVAESTGRWHTADKRRLLMIARGSLYETEHWLLRAEARGLIEEGTSKRTDEVARALNGLIKRPN
jgi:four helix bundle protein